jgi:hypothetical protein
MLAGVNETGHTGEEMNRLTSHASYGVLVILMVVSVAV